MSKSLKADVIIIGAGIIGASCAFRLSEQGLKVLILEAQNAPAMGSTGRSVLVFVYSLPKKSTSVFPGTVSRNTNTLWIYTERMQVIGR